MTLKPILCSLTILAITSFSTAHAKSPEMCEEMVISGKSSDEEIEACIKGEGETESIRELMAEKRIKAAQEESKSKSSDQLVVDNNFESKKFTDADLRKAAYGKAIYAQRIQYKGRDAKVKTLTESDDLCKYLGYEKAIGITTLSGEIAPTISNANGITIDVGLFGTSKELYKSENYYVRSFKSITCAKNPSKDEVVRKVFKEMKESIETLPGSEDLSPPKNEEKDAVNNTPRKSKDIKTTPFSYERVKPANQKDSSK
jgi:hypothetical protein